MYLNKDIRDIHHYVRDFPKFVNAVKTDVNTNILSKTLNILSTIVGFGLFLTIIPYALLLKIFKKDTKNVSDMSNKEKAIAILYYFNISIVLITFKFSKEVIAFIVCGIPTILVIVSFQIDMLARINHFFNKRYVYKHYQKTRSKVFKEFILNNRISTYESEESDNGLRDKNFKVFMKWKNKRDNLKIEDMLIIKKSDISDLCLTLMLISKWFISINETEVLLLVYNKNSKNDLSEICSQIKIIIDNLNAFTPFVIKELNEQVLSLLKGREREIQLSTKLLNINKKSQSAKKTKI